MNKTPSPTNKHYDINIPNALLYMKKEAYADTTIKAVGKRLRHLQKHSNLQDPENVKTFIANKTCTNAYKETLIEAYDILMRSINQQWNKPFYKRTHKLPKIPTTEKLDMLIARARPKMALFLSMSKDLGTRPIELTWLQIKDINLQTGIVNITSAKHCNPRTLKLKPKTLDMLKQYINKKHLKQTDRLFPTNPNYIGDSYRRLRNLNTINLLITRTTKLTNNNPLLTTIPNTLKLTLTPKPTNIHNHNPQSKTQKTQRPHNMQQINTPFLEPLYTRSRYLTLTVTRTTKTPNSQKNIYPTNR